MEKPLIKQNSRVNKTYISKISKTVQVCEVLNSQQSCFCKKCPYENHVLLHALCVRHFQKTPILKKFQDKHILQSAKDVVPLLCVSDSYEDVNDSKIAVSLEPLKINICLLLWRRFIFCQVISYLNSHRKMCCTIFVHILNIHSAYIKLPRS